MRDNIIVKVPSDSDRDSFYGFVDTEDAISFGKEFDGAVMYPVKTAVRDENGDWVL